MRNAGEQQAGDGEEQPYDLPLSVHHPRKHNMPRLLEAVWALLQGPEGNKSVGNDRISHMANEKEHAESGSSSTQT